MARVKQRFASVDEYIASFPPDVQRTLASVRRAIRSAAPDAAESVSYHMPTYSKGDWVVYFAGYKAHWSLFGNVEAARKKFAKELERYEASGRGTIRFPLDERVPAKLIRDIVAFSKP